MRDLPTGGRNPEALGPGTDPAVRAVPGRSRGRAVWDRVASARGRDASGYTRWSRVRGGGRGPRAAPAVPRQTPACAAVSPPRSTPAGASSVRLDRAAPSLSGAGFTRSLGSQEETLL